MGAQASTNNNNDINKPSNNISSNTNANNENNNNKNSKVSTVIQRDTTTEARQVERPQNANAYYRIPIRKSPSKNTEEKSAPPQIVEKSASKSEKSKSASETSEDSSIDRSESPGESETEESSKAELEEDKGPRKEEWSDLSGVEAKRVSEKAIQEAFKNPHHTFIYATPVTNVASEKIPKEGIFLDSVIETYTMSDEQIIYEIPLDSVGLRVARNRTTRSKVDPWRRHGALMKLCEIGGSVPESKGRGKSRSFSTIKKGSQPPPPPKTKPLTTVEEYMTFKTGNKPKL